MKNLILQFFRLDKTLPIPVYATDGSACFDFKASLEAFNSIKAFNSRNEEVPLTVSDDQILEIPPLYRVLIPTGLIADIPKKHVLKVYARSGLSVKAGLFLTNSVGVIDSDYVEPIFISMTNVSSKSASIKHGDRIAQGMLEKVVGVVVSEADLRPEPKSERSGGFGSTGK